MQHDGTIRAGIVEIPFDSPLGQLLRGVHNGLRTECDCEDHRNLREVTRLRAEMKEAQESKNKFRYLQALTQRLALDSAQAEKSGDPQMIGVVNVTAEIAHALLDAPQFDPIPEGGALIGSTNPEKEERWSRIWDAAFAHVEFLENLADD